MHNDSLSPQVTCGTDLGTQLCQLVAVRPLVQLDVRTGVELPVRRVGEEVREGGTAVVKGRGREGGNVHVQLV